VARDVLHNTELIKQSLDTVKMTMFPALGTLMTRLLQCCFFPFPTYITQFRSPKVSESQ